MEKELKNLDQIVMESLDFFTKNPPDALDLETYTLPFVVGSGNAYNTGTILFADKAAIFADESNFRSIIESYRPIIEKGLIKDAIIISASGEKDSVWEVELAKEYGMQTTLMTCEEKSSAAQIADTVLPYRKIAEPYTYNTSTYLGMMLSATKEDMSLIQETIHEISLPDNFGSYESYTFILPDRFSNICPMIDIKKSELFGPNLSLRAFPQGHARHAKFVIPSEKELVISIGQKNEYFGNPGHRWDIDFPEGLSFGAMLCLTYYLIGKIQASKHPYFKENVAAYCRDYGPRAYGKDIPFDIIVPGN